MRIELERQKGENQNSFFVINKWRDTSANMRTNFERIIFRAGLEKWERLFHKLLGNRSNELFTEYPAHIAAEWMGQSTKIAESHYFHATEEFFEKAAYQQNESDEKTDASNAKKKKKSYTDKQNDKKV